VSAYCSSSDVYTWIPRGSVQSPALSVASIATGSEIVTIDGHGLDTGDAVVFRAEAGGTMPSPLVAGTTYYAIRLTDATLQVSATVGGAPVNITTQGENVVLVVELPWARWIAQASNEIECLLPAHVVPITGTVPEIVRTYTAGLVAQRALAYCGVSLPPGFEQRIAQVMTELSQWRKTGATIRGAVVPTASNLAIVSSRTSTDLRGWTGRGEHEIP